MMMEVTPFQFPYVLEVLAVIAWSVSGAVVARSKGLDFMGVFVIATIATTGGGLLRDGLFLQRTPVTVTTPLYLIVPFGAMIIISLFGGLWEHFSWWDRLSSIIDAIGTPAFTLLGYQLSILAGIPFIGALFIGLLNGVSGGVLRDVLVGEVPRFFRPGQLSGSIAIGSVFLYAGLLASSNVSSDNAAWIAIVAAAIARWLVIRFNWRTQPVNEWHLERDLARMPREVSRRYRDAAASRGSEYDMD